MMHRIRAISIILCLGLIPSLLYSIDVKGTVYDTQMKPVANALVELIDQRNSNLICHDYTNDAGQYALQIKVGVKQATQIPADFKLFQNHPNPFNPSTKISWELPYGTDISITIYNILGQKIKTVFNGFHRKGSGEIIWDAKDDQGQAVPAGVYFYSLTTDKIEINKKMLLIDGSCTRDIINTSHRTVTGNVLCKASDQAKIYEYILRVTGNEIETYTQHVIISTQSVIIDVTVVRKISSMTDIDGNIYPTIKIGNQWWMAENLKVTHYRNGEVIKQITGTKEWSVISDGAYCNYENNANYVDTYGRLYNWYAVMSTNGLAPEGWHIPSDEEWKEMEMYLGMSRAEADAYGWRGANVGGKLKATGIIGVGNGQWFPPNTGATNESQFTALPGGFRNDAGYFFYLGYAAAFFWSSTEDTNGSPLSRVLEYNHSDISRTHYSKNHGLSIRCIRD